MSINTTENTHLFDEFDPLPLDELMRCIEADYRVEFIEFEQIELLPLQETK